MASRPISVVIKGEYSDRDVKRAIRDLQSLQTQAPKTAKSFQAVSTSFKGFALGFGAGAVVTSLTGSLMSMASAAAADQKSVALLGKTMKNLGLGEATGGVEEFIKAQMLATGVADDQLRPAMSRLLRSTNDVTQAQSALQLALDISSATGKDLDTVANGLGKAYDGNAASLGRLGLGLDKALLKSGDMLAITTELRSKFGGQAATAADTYAGRLQRVATAAGEAGETIGYSLLDAVDKLSSALGGTDGAVSGVTQLGTGAAGLIDQFTGLIDILGQVGAATAENNKQDQYSEDTYRNFVSTIPFIGLQLAWLSGQHEENARAVAAEAAALDAAHNYSDRYAAALKGVNSEEENRAATLEASKSAAERLKGALDKLYGTNRNILSSKIDLRAGFAEGPQGHMVGKGKNAHELISRDDALKWAISQSATASDIAQAYAGKGQFKKALDVWRTARGQVMSGVAPYGVGRDTVDSFMGPAPKSWRREYADNQAKRNANEWRTNAAPIYLTMTVNAQTPADAVQWAKDAARLAQLNRGMATADDSHNYDAARRRVAGR